MVEPARGAESGDNAGGCVDGEDVVGAVARGTDAAASASALRVDGGGDVGHVVALAAVFGCASTVASCGAFLAAEVCRNFGVFVDGVSALGVRAGGAWWSLTWAPDVKGLGEGGVVGVSISGPRADVLNQ